MDVSGLEKTVFRKIISNPEILAKYIGKISPQDFTMPLLQNVMGAFADNPSVVSTYVPNKHFFEILLRDRIPVQSELEYAADVISGIASNPVDAKDIDVLIRELQANRMCREMAQIIQRRIPLIQPDTVEQAYDDLLKDLLQLPLSASSQSVARVKEIHDDIENRVLEYLTESSPKIPACIKAFDAVMGGFAYGEFVVVTAGTGQGKSNIMLWWAEQFVERGYNCLYVTIEMSYEETMNRYHAIQTGFNVLDISHRRIPRDNQYEYFEKLIAANKEKAARAAFLRECEVIKDRSNPNHALAIAKKYKNRESKMYMMDIDSCTPLRVEREIQRIAMDHKIDCVFVDFLNVMDPEFHNKDRVRELTSIAREMKKVARRNNVVMFTAAQMDTSTLENTQEERISTDKVKYARAIAENADWMIAFNRTEEDNLLKQIRLQMAKHRHSSDCTALLEFDFANLQAIDHGFAPKTFVPYGYNQLADKVDGDFKMAAAQPQEPTHETVKEVFKIKDVKILDEEPF